jgi:hypothetical protein
MAENQITKFRVRNHYTEMNIQLNLTRQSWEGLTQVTQLIPPKSRYSNEDFDTIHPLWIGCKKKKNQIIYFNIKGEKDKA